MTINGSDIYMTRGDNEIILVSCRERPFSDGDKVELTVRRVSGYGSVLLHKEVTRFTEDGKALIEITPEDTSALSFGNYSYDVQATFMDLGVKTIVRPSQFTVGKEETYAD